MKMVHNRSNEEVVVEQYTTRLHEQLSRLGGTNFQSGGSVLSSRSFDLKKSNNRSRNGQLAPIKESSKPSSSARSSAHESSGGNAGSSRHQRTINSSSDERDDQEPKQQEQSPDTSLHHKSPRNALMDWLKDEEELQKQNQDQHQQYKAIRMDGSLFESNGW